MRINTLMLGLVRCLIVPELVFAATALEVIMVMTMMNRMGVTETSGIVMDQQDDAATALDAVEVEVGLAEEAEVMTEMAVTKMITVKVLAEEVVDAGAVEAGGVTTRTKTAVGGSSPSR